MSNSSLVAEAAGLVNYIFLPRDCFFKLFHKEADDLILPSCGFNLPIDKINYFIIIDGGGDHEEQQQ